MAGWAPGLAGWPRGGNGWTDGQTENLSILQDFIPYRDRCPASPMKTKLKVEQGKGTADHLMPLGYLFVRLDCEQGGRTDKISSTFYTVESTGHRPFGAAAQKVPYFSSYFAR